MLLLSPLSTSLLVSPLQVGHHAEAGGEEGGVADGLDDSDEEGEADEDLAVLDVVEEAEGDGHAAGGDDAAAKGAGDTDLVEILPEQGGHEEDGELEDAEHEAVLSGGGALSLGLGGVEGGLKKDAL